LLRQAFGAIAQAWEDTRVVLCVSPHLFSTELTQTFPGPLFFRQYRQTIDVLGLGNMLSRESNGHPW
jgi:hypothetical protein